MARSVAVVVAVVVLVVGGGAARAQSNRCNAVKLKAAGNKAAAKAVCHAKGVAKGLAPDPFCLSRAEGKFSAAFQKAESRPPCLTTADAGAVEARIDALIDTLGGDLPDGGPSRCEAGKWRAAGKKARGKLLCHSKAVVRATRVDPACLGKFDARFAAAFVKADAAGPCAGSASAVEGVVDDAVDQVATDLGSGSNVCPACCASTHLSFTTTAGAGVCGSVAPAFCVGTVNPGASCTVDADCTRPDVCDSGLACGALYAGGGAVQMTLPALVPDGSQSIARIVNCSPDTTQFDVLAAPVADTGSIRTCT